MDDDYTVDDKVDGPDSDLRYDLMFSQVLQLQQKVEVLRGDVKACYWFFFALGIIFCLHVWGVFL